MAIIFDLKKSKRSRVLLHGWTTSTVYKDSAFQRLSTTPQTSFFSMILLNTSASDSALPMLNSSEWEDIPLSAISNYSTTSILPSNLSFAPPGNFTNSTSYGLGTETLISILSHSDPQMSSLWAVCLATLICLFFLFGWLVCYMCRAFLAGSVASRYNCEGLRGSRNC